jgi:hypothetical protein
MIALRMTLIALLAGAAVAQAQTPAPDTSSAPAKSVQSAKKAHPAEHKDPMDLHAPPLSHIYPRQELQYILAYEPDEDQPGEVSVKGSKTAVNVPVSPGNQLQAIPWALLHPTEAWRIITPVESP